MARSARPQSAASSELTARIKELRQAGVSVRETARRTGISKSQVSAIELGTRRAAERTARAALETLGEFIPERRVPVKDRGWEWVAPATDRDFKKWSRVEHGLRRAQETVDYRLERHGVKRSDLRMRVLGEGGKTRIVEIESNPAILYELGEAGLLAPDEVKRGPSPSVSALPAASP